MYITPSEAKRIKQLSKKWVDVKQVPACFKLADPSDEKCYIYGKPICIYFDACKIFAAEIFKVDHLPLTDMEIILMIKRRWDAYRDGTLDSRIKENIDDRKNSKEYKFKIKSTPLMGAYKCAEEFWLKNSGTYHECLEYVKRKYKGKGDIENSADCGVRQVIRYATYPYRMTDDNGKLHLVDYEPRWF